MHLPADSHWLTCPFASWSFVLTCISLATLLCGFLGAGAVLGWLPRGNSSASSQASMSYSCPTGITVLDMLTVQQQQQVVLPCRVTMQAAVTIPLSSQVTFSDEWIRGWTWVDNRWYWWTLTTCGGLAAHALLPYLIACFSLFERNFSIRRCSLPMEDDCRVLLQLKLDGRQGTCEMRCVCQTWNRNCWQFVLCCRKTRLCEGMVCCTGVSAGAISLVKDPQPSFVFGCQADKRRAIQSPLNLDKDMPGKILQGCLEEHCHLRLSITAEDAEYIVDLIAQKLPCN